MSVHEVGRERDRCRKCKWADEEGQTIERFVKTLKDSLGTFLVAESVTALEECAELPNCARGNPTVEI